MIFCNTYLYNYGNLLLDPKLMGGDKSMCTENCSKYKEAVLYEVINFRRNTCKAVIKAKVLQHRFRFTIRITISTKQCT